MKMPPIYSCRSLFRPSKCLPSATQLDMDWDDVILYI